MTCTILKDDGEFTMVRIDGRFERPDLDLIQALSRQRIERGIRPRVLALLGAFEGWGRSGDWDGDVAFASGHGNDIARIAVVGDEKWKDDVFLFVWKDLRTTPVEFFPAARLAEAEAWVRG